MFAEAPKHSFEWYTVPCLLGRRAAALRSLHTYCVIYTTIPFAPALFHRLPTCTLYLRITASGLYHRYMYLGIPANLRKQLPVPKSFPDASSPYRYQNVEESKYSSEAPYGPFIVAR